MKQIPLYKFHKRKYAHELSIDVLDLDYIKPGIRKAPVHRESFYCIILITEGCEEVAINGNKCTLRSGEGGRLIIELSCVIGFSFESQFQR